MSRDGQRVLAGFGDAQEQTAANLKWWRFVHVDPRKRRGADLAAEALAGLEDHDVAPEPAQLEWSFGGEKHMSGALSMVEAFGRFAQYGVYSAFYWTHPPDGSALVQGFLAFRNFAMERVDIVLGSVGLRRRN